MSWINSKKNYDFLTATLIMSAETGVSSKTFFTTNVKEFKFSENYLQWKKIFDLADKLTYTKKPSEKDIINDIVKDRKNRGFYPQKSRS